MEKLWDSRCPREKIFERKSVEFLFFSTAGRTDLGFWWSTTVFDKKTNNFVHIESKNRDVFVLEAWYDLRRTNQTHNDFSFALRRSSQRKVEEQTPFPQWTQWICNWSRLWEPNWTSILKQLNVTSRELDVDSVWFLVQKNRRKFMRFKIQSIFLNSTGFLSWNPALSFFEEMFPDDSGPKKLLW